MLEFAKPIRTECLIRSSHHVIEVDKERIINIIFADEDRLGPRGLRDVSRAAQPDGGRAGAGN